MWTGVLRGSRRALGTALVLSACALGGGRAHAQSPSEIAAAQGWFNEGMSLEGAGRWKDALERFRRVAAVKRTPQVDFHVGLCESKVGELVPALVDLGRALESARAQHVANVESAAAAELETLRPRVPRVRISVPRGATVTKTTIDDRPVASVTLAEPIAVDPGSHVLIVSFASGDVQKRFTLDEGGHATLEIEAPLVAPTPAPLPPPARVPDAPPPSPPPPADRGGRTLGWVLVGTGGAAIVGGAIFWALRQGEISDLDAACGADRQRCPESARSHYDAGKLDTLVSATMLGAGVVAAGVGAALLLTGTPTSAKTGALVIPLVAPGGGGAAVTGRF